MVPETIPRSKDASDWAYVATYCNHTRYAQSDRNNPHLVRPGITSGMVLIDNSAMEGSGGGPVAIITDEDLVAMDQAVYFDLQPDGDDYSKFISLGITHRVASDEEIEEDGAGLFIRLE